MSPAERAFALVKEGSALRSSALAELLECSADNVHELLLPYVHSGALVACDVEIRGQHLKDYRLSVACGGAAPEFITMRPRPEERRPPTPLPPTPPRERAPVPEQPKEARPMSTSDRIEAAFLKHGPMTSRELRKHVKDPSVGGVLTQCADRGRFARLGGTKGAIVWGMPHQEAPAAGAGPRSSERAKQPAKGKPRKEKAARLRAAARLHAATLKARRVANVERGRQFADRPGSNGFRPAIAADGALLLIGAAQAGELSRPEVRVLAEFLRRVDETGIRA